MEDSGVTDSSQQLDLADSHNLEHTNNVPDVWPSDVESYFQRLIRKHVLQFDMISASMSEAIQQRQFASWAKLNLNPEAFTPEICRAHFASSQRKKDSTRVRPAPVAPASPATPEPTRPNFSFLSGLETPAGQRNVLTDAPISSIFEDAHLQLPHRVAAAGRVQLRDLASGCSSDEEVVTADARPDGSAPSAEACGSESGSDAGLDPTRMDIARYTKAVLNQVLRETDMYDSRAAPRARGGAGPDDDEEEKRPGVSSNHPETPTAAHASAETLDAAWGANDSATSRYIQSSRQLATARALLDVMGQAREVDEETAAAAALDEALDAELAMLNKDDV